jgi:hypothetical protein
LDAAPENRELTAFARERVRVGPVPEWVAASSYNPDFVPKSQGLLTWFLFEQQVEGELGETYTRSGYRLETMKAVQQFSQWHIQFEPQTRSVVLHSVKIRRVGQEIEQLPSSDN